MKKLVMSFLVVGLMVVSAVSLSSCKKTSTNENENTEASIPVVYDYIIIDDEDQSLSKDEVWIDCYYCPHFPIHYPNNRLYKCDHNPPFIDEAFDCEVHSHHHYFEVTDNCTPPGQVEPYFCEYNGFRKHMHILTYTSRYFHNSWHLGGGAGSE